MKFGEREREMKLLAPCESSKCQCLKIAQLVFVWKSDDTSMWGCHIQNNRQQHNRAPILWLWVADPCKMLLYPLLVQFSDWMPHIVVPSCLHCKLVRFCAPNQCQQSPCEKLESRVPPNRDCIWYICVYQNSQISSQWTSYAHHLNQSVVLFYVMFILCFTTGKVHGCGTFPKCRTMLAYCFILGPVFLEFPPPWGLTLLKIAYKTRNQKTETFFPSVR